VLGGETRSPLWTQIKSDVTGCTIEVPLASEASAYGASLLAGVGAGVFRDVPDAIRRAVNVAARYEPDPAEGRRYEALFGHYDSAVRRQFPDWPASPGSHVTPVAGAASRNRA
jgi:sugar (pentulose or hexulose) kinase